MTSSKQQSGIKLLLLQNSASAVANLHSSIVLAQKVMGLCGGVGSRKIKPWMLKKTDSLLSQLYIC